MRKIKHKYNVTINYVKIPKEEQEERMKEIVSALVDGVIDREKKVASNNVL